MTDLITWLRTQLDTDERRAAGAGGREWEVGPVFGARENMVRIREQDVLVDSVGSCAESWAFVGQVASIPNWRENAQHIATHDPARVLRQVQAHRAILAALEAAQIRKKAEWRNYQRWIDGKPDKSVPDGPPEGAIAGLELAVRHLASIYSDRDGYDPDWSA